MNHEGRIELFVLKCAVIEKQVRANNDEHNETSDLTVESEPLTPFIRQFDLETRKNAARMARYYQIFYLLENDIRRLIEETLEAANGEDWWEDSVPQHVREEATRNRTREEQAGVSIRSENQIDYTTFGQLNDIIKDNWQHFAGMLSNQPAVQRVLSGLNMLRGTIAHCGVLAEDEVDRLHLAIRDWSRVLEGPKT